MELTLKTRGNFNMVVFHNVLWWYQLGCLSSGRFQGNSFLSLGRGRRKEEILKLNISMFSCTPCHEENGMASAYFMDDAKDYCFSLSRLPESEEIEVMVFDQILSHVTSLSVTLKRDSLVVNRDHETALMLDGNTHYELFFHADEKEFHTIFSSVQKIFEGK